MTNFFYRSLLVYGLLDCRILRSEGVLHAYEVIPNFLCLKATGERVIYRTLLKFLHKFVLILSTAPLLVGCTSPFPQAHSEQPPEELTQPIVTTPLKAALEELRVLKIKVAGGVNQKEYGEDLTDLENIVKSAYGDPTSVAATKSALEGHKLALQFWRCDRETGYETLHQCQDKVLKQVFKKYPDIEEQAQAAVAGENLPYISAGLDKDAVLQAIWLKTAEDTDAALQAVNPISNLKKNSR